MLELTEKSPPFTSLPGFLSTWAFCLCSPPHGHNGASAASAVLFSHTHRKGKTKGFFGALLLCQEGTPFQEAPPTGFSLNFTMLIFRKLMVSTIYVLKSLDTMILNLPLEPFFKCEQLIWLICQR